MKIFEKQISSAEEMMNLGVRIGARLAGGEVLELVGDVGAGKTTFTKGLARSLGVCEAVQSPTFTISRIYDGDNLTLTHYDFYRLNDAGIMRIELAESLKNPQNITVVEWAEDLAEVLPSGRIRIEISSLSEDVRKVRIEVGENFEEALAEFADFESRKESVE